VSSTVDTRSRRPGRVAAGGFPQEGSTPLRLVSYTCDMAGTADRADRVDRGLGAESGSAESGSARSGSADLEKIRLEREFYLRLLELGTQTELEPFLEEALALVVEIAGAQQGYLELHGASDDVEHGWSIAHGFSDPEIEQVRARISSGVLAEALSTGEIVDTASAMLDPRFLGRKSVQAARIEAILCAPIGRISETRGVHPENLILAGSRSLIETRPQPRDAPARRRPARGRLRRRR
jgi:hypothetical protein